MLHDQSQVQNGTGFHNQGAVTDKIHPVHKPKNIICRRLLQHRFVFGTFSLC